MDFNGYMLLGAINSLHIKHCGQCKPRLSSFQMVLNIIRVIFSCTLHHISFMVFQDDSFYQVADEFAAKNCWFD